MKLYLKNTFTTNLPADVNLENTPRQVSKACFSYVIPKETAAPKLLHVSSEMLENIGLYPEDSEKKEFLNVFTGNTVLENTTPYAMCYGGHQFGHWAGQLGDGRAINLFEVSHQGKNWKLQLKGAGPTPYSRTADGLAVLRSSVREYLCSEAMFHLGVPTTRALSLALSGDQVLRDILYNGNPDYEKGAIVCRVSPSFLRFGSYEILASKQDFESLKTLINFTITSHYPEFINPNNVIIDKDTYNSFFHEVAKRSLDMVIHWQRVGFVHGVMNTDNMSILGLTIDYGPYGWLEGYDLGWTPNTTDHQNKRYKFGAQIDVVLWNLYQLANALYPLIGEADGLEKTLQDFSENSKVAYLDMMRSKLGLTLKDKSDVSLINSLEDCLQLTETDMTIFFRNLAHFNSEEPENWKAIIEAAFYTPNTIDNAIIIAWNNWFKSYSVRLNLEHVTHLEKIESMNAVNPKYVLRNYMSQIAIDLADKGDYSLIDELFIMLKKPYSEQPEYQKWFSKRPEWARNKVGCSMLSCSS